jgi:hypothetical protein
VPQLLAKSFAAWPPPAPIQPRTRFSVERDRLLFRAVDFFSQPNVPLRLYVLGSIEHAQPRRIVLNILDSEPSQPRRRGSPETVLEWNDLLEFMNTEFPDMPEEPSIIQTNTTANQIDLPVLKRWILTNHAAVAFIAPRGLGLSVWSGNERAQTQIRRRFMLLGQTLDSMRVWDIRRAVQALRVLHSKNVPISLQAEGSMAVNALYASLFEPVASLQLWNIPVSQVQGPDYLNVLRVVDIPQVMLLALNQHPVQLHGVTLGDWQPIIDLAKRSAPRFAKGDRGPWFSVGE